MTAKEAIKPFIECINMHQERIKQICDKTVGVGLGEANQETVVNVVNTDEVRLLCRHIDSLLHQVDTTLKNYNK